MGKSLSLPVSAGLFLLSACGSDKFNLPAGPDAYSRIPPASVADVPREYRVGPLDTLSISVFGNKDLSINEAQVDAAGNILLPLIGKVTAAGKTTSDLSGEIAQRLGERYLVNPQVTVLVESSVSQKVTVDGAVGEAGVYKIQGQATLLEVLAMAKGTSNVAAENEVAVFRTLNSQRMGAIFDVAAIRRGEAQDPEVLGGDVVVVGRSGRRGAWRDFLTAAPAFAVFIPLAGIL